MQLGIWHIHAVLWREVFVRAGGLRAAGRWPAHAKQSPSHASLCLAL
jgi:hypothetical protein